MKKGLLNLLLTIISGILIGLDALYLGAYAYDTQTVSSKMLIEEYFKNNLLLFLNLLLPVLAVMLFYFVFSRLWAGALLGGLATLFPAYINYFKISLRDTPLLMEDVKVFKTALGVAGRYTYDIDIHVIHAAEILILIVLALAICDFFIKKNIRLSRRGLCVCVIAAMVLVSVELMYKNKDVLNKCSTKLPIDPYNVTANYAARGFVYSFVESSNNLSSVKPKGYKEKEAKALFNEYTDSDIPDDQKVSVLMIQLEAFADLSDFENLASIPEISEHYEEWHELENNNVYGNIINNVFGGNTTNTEWGVLTGYTEHDDFRTDVNSYVRYFASQGYDTKFYHTGRSWFYFRNAVCDYLGFKESLFSENYFKDLIDPDYAPFRSDYVMVDKMMEDVNAATGPGFYFGVGYQGHGPYSSTKSVAEIITTSCGLSVESVNILNNYLERQADTIDNMVRISYYVKEECTKPAILVIYGDHKPWAGNGNSVYKEVNVSFDFSTPGGFSNYYSTPYVIVANDAAKKLLGRDLNEEMPIVNEEVSNCFLMTELFNYCGWDGPAFMKASRDIMQLTPIISDKDYYMIDGNLTNKLSEKDQKTIDDFMWLQYYYQTKPVKNN